MNTINAVQTRDWCLKTMHYLAQTPAYGSQVKVNSRLAKRSGLSYSRIDKFAQGRNLNVQVETLDRLTDALKEMLKEIT